MGGLLEAWLKDTESDVEMSCGPSGEALLVWESVIIAVRAVPPSALREALPSFLEALRDCCGTPPNITMLLTDAFGACTTTHRLQTVAHAILHGEEKDITVVVDSLAHCACRLVAREI